MFIDAVERDGGHYFNADSERELRGGVARRRHDRKEGRSSAGSTCATSPVYQWFAVPALQLLLAAALAVRTCR